MGWLPSPKNEFSEQLSWIEIQLTFARKLSTIAVPGDCALENNRAQRSQFVSVAACNESDSTQAIYFTENSLNRVFAPET
jgi:hypothetical protein